MPNPDRTPLTPQRDLFDLPREVAYLNAAYITPLPRSAVLAGEVAARRKGRPWSITPGDFFTDSERARGLAGRLMGADAEGIAVVPGASYGIAVAAANLRLGSGRRVVTTADQFPSNVYSWRRLAAEQGGEVVAVEAGADGDLTAAVLAAIDERCAVAALPHCRWTDGRLLDLVAIGQRCREAGAALVLDLTQSLGVLPFDAGTVQPDFAVAASYKWLLGPYSLGWLYVAPQHREGRPLEENWIGRAGSEDFTRLVAYAEGYQPGARRFDMGARASFALMPVAMAGLELLQGLGPARIAAMLAAHTGVIAERASGLGLEAVPAHLRAGHYLGLRFPGGAPPDLTARLAAEGVHVSLRGDRLRVTPHVYNDAADVERLLAVLARAVWGAAPLRIGMAAVAGA